MPQLPILPNKTRVCCADVDAVLAPPVTELGTRNTFAATQRHHSSQPEMDLSSQVRKVLATGKHHYGNISGRTLRPYPPRFATTANDGLFKHLAGLPGGTQYCEKVKTAFEMRC